MAKAHPGFKAVQSKIASERGVSKERAGAILAASTRGASAAAKKANPRLKRVKGGNTDLPAGSMKRAGLVEGPKHNKSVKNSFAEGTVNLTDASQASTAELGSYRPQTKDASLRDTRASNLKRKEHERSGAHRRENLAAKDEFADCNE